MIIPVKHFTPPNGVYEWQDVTVDDKYKQKYDLIFMQQLFFTSEVIRTGEVCVHLENGKADYWIEIGDDRIKLIHDIFEFFDLDYYLAETKGTEQ